MKTNNINNKTAFGTTPQIGEISISTGLSKYRQSLSTGILNAFDRLAQNGNDDEFIIDIGHNAATKDRASDIMTMIFARTTRDANNKPKREHQSSVSFEPAILQRFSARKITQIILNSYKKLLNNNTLAAKLCDDYPFKENNKVSNAHKKVLNELAIKYHYDDMTCA